jgi:uncharacterized SAM-binding protein YcdF (DUF218 family)
MTALLAALSLGAFVYWLALVLRGLLRSSLVWFWPLLSLYLLLAACFPLWRGLLLLPAALFFLCFLLYALAACRTVLPCGGKDYDVVLVLGVRSDGTLPKEIAHDRAKLCAELLSKSPRAAVILSGGRVFGERETEACTMLRLLLSLGVPRERILLEEDSRTTQENFRRAPARFPHSCQRLAVVTSRYHLLRAFLLCPAPWKERAEWYGAPFSGILLFHLYFREWITFAVDLLRGNMHFKKGD